MTQYQTITSKDFILVAIGQIVSLFGNQILRYALPLYLLNETGSSALFGTISACAFLPMLLLFPIGGMIADRRNKRNIMVLLDGSTAVVTLVFMLLERHVNIVILMAVTMMILFGIQGAYQPTVKASIPYLVKEEQMLQANSIVDVINSLASMAGPILGGILYSIVGLRPILYVSMICFSASAFMELLICIPYEKQVKKGRMLAICYQDLKESFQFLCQKQPVLCKMALLYAAINLFMNSLILIGIPVIITQHLNFSSANANRLYGYAQGVIALGSMLGGMLAGVLAKKLRPKMIPNLLCGGAAAMMIAGSALHFLPQPMIVYVILTISCGGILLLETVFTIQIMAYIQILSPKHLIGKVISCIMCISMCTNPLGQLLYGIIFEKIGNAIALPFYLAALLVILIVFFTKSIFSQLEALLAI